MKRSEEWLKQIMSPNYEQPGWTKPEWYSWSLVMDRLLYWSMWQIMHIQSRKVLMVRSYWPDFESPPDSVKIAGRIQLHIAMEDYERVYEYQSHQIKRTP